MNHPLPTLCCLAIFALGCRDNNSAKQIPKECLNYEVITSSGNWNGEYDDASGTRVNIHCSQVVGFIRSYQITGCLICSSFAEADCPPCDGTRDPSPDVSIDFYVDGKQVKTSTNAWAKGVNSLLYTVN
jgi:hypothetical protein